MRLFEMIGQWLGRVEIALSGSETDFAEAKASLENGNPHRARFLAQEILARLPGSPIALAVWADACEAAHLDAELAMALDELSHRFPSRAEIWLRLATVRLRQDPQDPTAREALTRALALGTREIQDAALLLLAQMDVASDPTRAHVWLDRLLDDRTPEAASLRAQAFLAAHRPEDAAPYLRFIPDEPPDAERSLTKGLVLAALEKPEAYPPLLRAFVLGVPSADAALAALVSRVPPGEVLYRRIRTVIDSAGQAHLPRWRAAFLRHEGDVPGARAALAEATRQGDAESAALLLQAAIDDRDEPCVRLALLHLPPSFADSELAVDLQRLLDPSGAPLERVSTLLSLRDERLRPWASQLASDIYAGLLPDKAPANWTLVLSRLDEHAERLHDLEAASTLSELARSRSRPVRLAIVGEFNAGKSTFINALMGEEIAPMGVLPTTATLHHLQYAQDPFARIHLATGDARVVGTRELRAVLAGISTADVARVDVFLPLALLRRVEMIDTPGFNAPDQAHMRSARQALAGSDALVWLLDAAQPLKRSEREILEEAQRLGIPVQVLVNKADRLNEAQLVEVMKLVTDSLFDNGLRSIEPPMGISAKLALEGRLGNAAALERSNWSAVERLLERAFVARSEHVKEGALRRHASVCASKLEERAKELTARVEDERRRLRERETASKVLANRLFRDADKAVERIREQILHSAEMCGRELALVRSSHGDPDPSLERYRIERALARIAPPLSEALLALANETSLDPAEARLLARTVARSISWNPATERDLATLAEAAIGALGDALSRGAASRNSEPPFHLIGQELAILQKRLRHPFFG